jgi:hypothetical protein
LSLIPNFLQNILNDLLVATGFSLHDEARTFPTMHLFGGNVLSLFRFLIYLLFDHFEQSLLVLL